MLKLKKILFISICCFPIVGFSQELGDIIKYKTDSGLELNLNSKDLNKFIDSNKKYLQRIKSCSRDEIKFYNPFFGTNDYYKIIGRNNQRDCVIEYSHAGLSNHRCALNKYQIEDLIDSKLSRINKKDKIEFKTKEEAKIYNSENCIVKYNNMIEGGSSQSDIDKAVKKNPNIKSVLMLMNRGVN